MYLQKKHDKLGVNLLSVRTEDVMVVTEAFLEIKQFFCDFSNKVICIQKLR